MVFSESSPRIAGSFFIFALFFVHLPKMSNASEQGQCATGTKVTFGENEVLTSG